MKVTNPSSRRVRTFSDLVRFSPRLSVAILVKPMASRQDPILKVWALDRLLSWIVLDQPQRPNPEAKGKSRISSRNAVRAGHYAIGCLAERDLRLQLAKLQTSDLIRFFGPTVANFDAEVGAQMNMDRICSGALNLFAPSGGLSVCLQGHSGPSYLLLSARKATRELGYVYRIVEYLCRYHEHFPIAEHHRNFTIESARSFVELWAHEDQQTYGSSKISKIWDRYRKASPYIFAFYRFFAGGLQRTKSVADVVNWSTTLIEDQERLERLVGRAAYAADILVGRARDVRVDDFKNVSRQRPHLRDFNAYERLILESIDRQSPIA